MGGVVKPHNLPMFEEQTDSADDGAVDGVDPTTKESVRRRIARWEVRGTRDQNSVVEQTGSVNEEETSYSWDLLKTFNQDMIIDQTDSASCASEEEMHCFVGNLISAWSRDSGADKTRHLFHIRLYKLHTANTYISKTD